MNLIAAELTDAQIADLGAWYAALQVEVTVPGR
jgi:cytochrome c553